MNCWENKEKSYGSRARMLLRGPKGRDGEKGADGLPGSDGYSPAVDIESIENGTRVTITDANGSKSFDVMDANDEINVRQNKIDNISVSDIADSVRQSVIFSFWAQDDCDSREIIKVGVETTAEIAEGTSTTVRFALYSLTDNGDGTGILTLEKVLGDAEAADGEAMLTIDGGYVTDSAKPVLVACAESAIIPFLSSSGTSIGGLPYFDDADYFGNSEGAQIVCGTDQHTLQYPGYYVEYKAATSISVEDFANEITATVETLETRADDMDDKTDTIAEELAQLRADFEYVEISVTSFSVSPSVAEAGIYYQNPVVSWRLNKAPATLTLSYGDTTVELEAAASGQYTVAGGFNATTTFTLTATDERSVTKTKTATMNFYTAIYYGMAALPEAVNATFVQSLPNKVLSNQKNRSFTVSGGEGLYFWYVYQTYYGKSRFNIGGFDYELEPTTLLLLANGRMQNHYVYRSENPIPDTVSITVKD